MTTGHTIAISSELSATQPPVSTPGLPNRSRVALIVAEIGFHVAIAPSQPGISSMAMNALDSIVTGYSSPYSEFTDSAFFAFSPSRMPSHRNARRSSSRSPNAATASPNEPCQRQPIASPVATRIARLTAE